MSKEKPVEVEVPAEQDTFSEVLKAIDATEYEPERHVSIQIDDALREAICAAQTSNQSASVTITVKVKPGPERRVSFAANVNAKIPRPPVSAVTLFADANGNVHKSDPAQQRLGFYDATSTRKQES